MRGFFEHIKTKINTDLTDYMTVEYYNSNDVNLEALKEGGILFPAVYVEFIFNEINHLSLGIKNMDMTVRFRFMYENYTKSRLDDLDSMTAFTAVMDLWTGKEDDDYQFTPFLETFRQIDSNHDMVNIPFIDYQTNYRNIENYIGQNSFVHTPVAPDVSGEID